MTNEFDILSLFDRKIAPYIRELTSRLWIPPSIISNNIKKKSSETPSLIRIYDQVIVSGETNNISIYLIGKENIIIFTPFESVKNNIVFLDTLPKVLIKYNDNLYLVKQNKEIIDRLSFPKIVLINPSVKDVFPAPRLALCVASLAGYIRKYQKADVHIIDMQVGSTIDTIIQDIEDIRPDIIGISISFGQLPLVLLLLERIFENNDIMNRKPTIIAGNVIASLGYKGLLKKFPELIICNGEGESTIIGLVERIKGKCPLENVPGIIYIKNNQVKKNAVVEIDMNDAPFPSMDTFEEIIRNKGSLTLELSRGCFHSACTFCPRTNKPIRWKGISSHLVLKQLEHYKHIFDYIEGPRRIFMADEEFIGWAEDGKESERIMEISKGMINRNFKISFETNTRVDQIYNPKKDREWHIDRMKMLNSCRKAGLDRLLIGVESGSDSILERFNKKIKSFDSIMACRILTSLGIGLRVTFITFDPLMNFSELKENVFFLERKDAFLKPTNLSKINCTNLFDRINDDEYISKNSINRPFYENVSYMLVNLEVLMESDYFYLINKDLLINNEPDYSMARYKTQYKDEIIGDIAIFCQKWIDKHFALDYCLKGLYKISTDSERMIFLNHREHYRKLSFLLLKSLIWIFDKEDSINLLDNRSDLKNVIVDLEYIKHSYQSFSKNRNEIIISTLDLFDNKKMLLLINDIMKKIDVGEINNGKDELIQVIQQWKEKSEWTLINP